eukprot:3587932-Amphidinium_carterae.1
MITEIYQQSEAKHDAAPAYQHRLLMFLVQHYALKVPFLLQSAGATIPQCNQVLQHFDEYAEKYFTRVNTRPLSEIQRAQQLERLRPGPLPQEPLQYQDDITEEEDEDFLDEYDETRSTTRASASGSNIVHLEKANALKRKMTGEARGKQKKQGDVITNFYNVKIGNYHAATSSTSTEQLKRSSKTADNFITATPRVPRTPTT